jgi:hypothetical protein
LRFEQQLQFKIIGGVLDLLDGKGGNFAAGREVKYIKMGKYFGFTKEMTNTLDTDEVITWIAAAEMMERKKWGVK